MKRMVMLGSKKPTVEVVEELKTSGTWIAPKGCRKVDIFLVGGGGGGNGGYSANGGGGGYTTVVYDVPVYPGQSVPVTIGEGGRHTDALFTEGIASTVIAQSGKPTIFLTYKAMGGEGATGGCYVTQQGSETRVYKGGNGGSGGSAGGGNGGSDGSNGERKTGRTAGLGQGNTTKCPFNNKLYAGGGASAESGYGSGGQGGGGNAVSTYGTNGGVNTGGGGGGGWPSNAGDGGSGIIILRYRKYA